MHTTAPLTQEKSVQSTAHSQAGQQEQEQEGWEKADDLRREVSEFRNEMSVRRGEE